MSHNQDIIEWASLSNEEKEELAELCSGVHMEQFEIEREMELESIRRELCREGLTAQEAIKATGGYCSLALDPTPPREPY